MIEYPKIETLYNRDGKKKVVTSAVRLAEFELIRFWSLYEKINGTNVRISWTRAGGVKFGTRNTEKIAYLTPDIQAYLEKTFTDVLFENAFPKVKDEEVQLFGEGYGPKVDSSDGRYRADPAVRLFDVYIGNWWLEQTNIVDIAQKFGVGTAPFVAQIDYFPTSYQDLELLFSVAGGKSLVAKEDKGSGLLPEGVVARTSPTLFTRKGERLMWKLKFSDFDRWTPS